eukprot:gene5889-1379_t
MAFAAAASLRGAGGVTPFLSKQQQARREQQRLLLARREEQLLKHAPQRGGSYVWHSPAPPPRPFRPGRQYCNGSDDSAVRKLGEWVTPFRGWQHNAAMQRNISARLDAMPPLRLARLAEALQNPQKPENARAHRVAWDGRQAPRCFTPARDPCASGRRFFVVMTTNTERLHLVRTQEEVWLRRYDHMVVSDWTRGRAAPRPRRARVDARTPRPAAPRAGRGAGAGRAAPNGTELGGLVGMRWGAFAAHRALAGIACASRFARTGQYDWFPVIDDDTASLATRRPTRRGGVLPTLIPN